MSERDQFDDLCAEANKRDWFFMVTEWAGSPTKAIAVVACDEVEQRCYEGEGETAFSALTEAMNLARESEIHDLAEHNQR